ncbi:hypothetical protein EJ03DRAFT_325510 [Teratosphaeria nubilosa]|uniref:N-acetyltransferase domain-containing protein n=1 Tax=Teratosphaeria nubilosa TaxID=161662 RepID=A0A6G1LF22_9PEZI|nr:hypothetical protein EJ03DRAFT_325510 [Teratosphaeria nubilosa]
MGRTQTHLQPLSGVNAATVGGHRFLDVHLTNNGGGHVASHHSKSFCNATDYTLSLPHSIPHLRLEPHIEESTRVQLHRQKLKEQHRSALISKAVPGFRTSAAFFASLRTNLRLHASPPASPISTPPSMTGSVASLPPPSPLSQAVDSVMGDDEQIDAPVPPADPLEGVPELTTCKPTDTEERIDALNLVADSIAQQRQTANNHLISHPLNLAAVVAVIAITGRYMWETYHDYYYTGMTGIGLVMVFFAFLGYATKDYLFAAEDITWNWLGDGEIIITKFGKEVIGALVIDWVSGESRQKRKKAWRGEIKGWTVKLRYRKKGVGTALLEEAIKEAKQKGAETIEFAEDHANSKRFLPAMFNGPFNRRERWAREKLQELQESSPRRKKR